VAKDNKQGNQQKPQSKQNVKITINESNKISKDTGSFERSRKGTAGDSTNSTGPRKK
jgi:hypothetical protein